MQIHFQETPWDLYVTIAFTIVASAGILIALEGNFGAIVLILFAPGYVVVASIFPRNTEIDWTQRLALSLGVSLAVVPPIGLVLNFTPFGIQLVPTTLTLAVFTIVVGVAAHVRRMRVPSAERLSVTLKVTLVNWRSQTGLNRALIIGIAASIVSGAGAVVFVIHSSSPSNGFSEFYVLGPNGQPSKYPTQLNVSEPGNVLLTVENHEFTTVNYSIKIDLVGVVQLVNSTTGSNETVEANRTVWSWFNATLPDGKSWIQPYTFRINMTGLWKVQFVLFKNLDFSSGYRELHLFVRVT